MYDEGDDDDDDDDDNGEILLALQSNVWPFTHPKNMYRKHVINISFCRMCRH